MVSNPLESGPTVVVGGGERTLRGETILDGDGKDSGFGDEAVEVPVAEEGEGGFEAEAAAVEVDQDGEFFVIGIGLWEIWEVYASGDIGVSGNSDVFG